jgi:hypothetical protein
VQIEELWFWESDTLGRLDKRLGSKSGALGFWSRSTVRNTARDSDPETADYFAFFSIAHPPYPLAMVYRKSTWCFLATATYKTSSI